MIMDPILSSLVLFFCLCASALAEVLTREQCKSFSTQQMYINTNNLMKQADAALVPSKFARAVDGYLLLVLDENSGQEDGGGTNTLGFYNSILFDGTQVLPAGMCDIPTNEGNARCPADSYITDSWVLGPADAITFLHCTPCAVKYFGYDVIIGTRFTEQYPFYPGQNFGDPINNFIVNVSDKETEGVFNAPSLIIISGDGNAANDVSQAFQKATGLTESSISIFPMTHNTVRFWDRSGGQDWHVTAPDAFGFIMRITAPIDGLNSTDYQRYKSMKFPVRFYFADDEKKGSAPLTPPLLSRYSEEVIDETKELKDLLNQLNQTIQTTLLQEYNAIYTTSQVGDLSSYGCYDDWDVVLAAKNNNSFVGGTRDAIYGIPPINRYEDILQYQLKSNAGHILIGVLHSKVLNATYSSAGIDVLGWKLSTMTVSVIETLWFLDDHLIGSAARYFDDSYVKNNNNNVATAAVDQLFAIDYFPPNGCIDHKYPQWCVEYNPTDYLTTGLIPFLEVGERVYSVAKTTIGPAANTTIPTAILYFEVKDDGKWQRKSKD
jgi:hypothetical protein